MSASTLNTSLSVGSSVGSTQPAKIIDGVLLSPTIESDVSIDVTGSTFNAAIFGVENVLSGGASIGAEVHNHGVLNVGLPLPPASKMLNATSQLTTIYAGGAENVFAYGRSNQTHIEGGVQNVFQGGLSSGARIDAGAQQIVHVGGEAYNSVDAGLLEVLAGGTALDTSLQNGRQQVFGYAANTQVGANGIDEIESGGVAQGSVLSGYESADNYDVQIGYYFNSQAMAFEDVISGGESDNAVVGFGGILQVFVGGVANDSVVQSGGAEVVFGVSNRAIFHGGHEVDAGVSNDAQFYGAMVFIDGVANKETLVNSYAQVKVDGVANGGSITGSEEEVWGLSNAETVGKGSNLLVYGGGVANQTSIAGGVLTLNDGATASDVSFTAGSGGELVLAHASQIQAPLSGFSIGDKLDLQDLAWGHNYTKMDVGAGSSTLYVGNDAHTDAIQLLGDYKNATFTLSNDGAGGTLVEQVMPYVSVFRHAA